MADQYADFDDGTELHHDTVKGIQIRRRPVQHARLTAKQKEDIIRTASDAGIRSKNEFFVAVSSAAGRHINHLDELRDVELLRVLSALRSRKGKRKSSEDQNPDNLPAWKWPAVWKPKS